MKVLIVKISSIGDVIHTFPAAFLIKSILPDSQISWLVGEKSHQILINQPFLEDVFVLPDKFWKIQNWRKTLKTLRPARQIKWDAIIDFQGLLKTGLILPFLSGEKFGFHKSSAREPAAAWFANYRIRPRFKHIIEKNLSLAKFALRSLGCSTRKLIVDLKQLQESFNLMVCDKERIEVDRWWTNNLLNDFIVLCPNTTWPSKCWPTKHWIKLCELISSDQSLPVPVIIGKNYGQQAEELSVFEGVRLKVAPNFTLPQISYLLQRSKLLVAPDTGILHLADFLQVNSIGIFGPTLKSKHGPFWSEKNILKSFQVECDHQYKKDCCGQDCMQKLIPEEVFARIKDSFLEDQVSAANIFPKSLLNQEKAV